jgi:pimeloyl-ACP methyl ester carboxylesterase
VSQRAEPVRDGCWLDWGGSGPTLHFAHGNGFPPATYRKLLELLRAGYRVVTMEARPLWPGSDPQALTDWSEMACDLAWELDRRGARGAIGVGHSMGAVVSLLASVQDPGLLTGEHSHSFSPPTVRRVRRQVRGARVVVFNGAGHCVPMERPQEVGDAVLSFLAEAAS